MSTGAAPHYCLYLSIHLSHWTAFVSTGSNKSSPCGDICIKAKSNHMGTSFWQSEGNQSVSQSGEKAPGTMNISLGGTPNTRRHNYGKPQRRKQILIHKPPFECHQRCDSLQSHRSLKHGTKRNETCDRIPVSRINAAGRRRQELREPQEVGKPRGGGAEQEEGHAAARKLSVQPGEGE